MDDAHIGKMGGARVRRRTVLAGLGAVAAGAAAPGLIASPASAATKVRFAPGHYVWPAGLYWSTDKQAADLRAYDEVASNPYIKGFVINFNWAYFEGAAGNYSAGFKIVDDYLAKIASLPTKKFLIVHLAERSFGNPTTNVYPPYLINAGQVVVKPADQTWSGNLVSAAKMWDPAVMDRLIALSRAYAGRYDNHPNFGMFALGETALGVPNGFGGASQPAYYTQLKRWFTESKKVWTKTPLRLCANFATSDAAMRDLFTSTTTTTVPGGVAIGGPDPELPLPDITRTIQANRVFRGEDGGQDLRGVVPWVGEVQEMGLGTRFTETPQEIFDYYYNTMHANYMIWLRNTYVGDTPQRWPAILTYINSIQGRIHRELPTLGDWELV